MLSHRIVDPGHFDPKRPGRSVSISRFNSAVKAQPRAGPISSGCRCVSVTIYRDIILVFRDDVDCHHEVQTSSLNLLDCNRLRPVLHKSPWSCLLPMYSFFLAVPISEIQYGTLAKNYHRARKLRRPSGRFENRETVTSTARGREVETAIFSTFHSRNKILHSFSRSHVPSLAIASCGVDGGWLDRDSKHPPASATILALDQPCSTSITLSRVVTTYPHTRSRLYGSSRLVRWQSFACWRQCTHKTNSIQGYLICPLFGYRL